MQEFLDFHKQGFEKKHRQRGLLRFNIYLLKQYLSKSAYLVSILGNNSSLIIFTALSGYPISS